MGRQYFKLITTRHVFVKQAGETILPNS